MPSFAANAQLKNMDMKWKNNFMQRMRHDQNFSNVQKLAAGSYYLKVETDKKITTLKFVKQ